MNKVVNDETSNLIILNQYIKDYLTKIFKKMELKTLIQKKTILILKLTLSMSLMGKLISV